MVLLNSMTFQEEWSPWKNINCNASLLSAGDMKSIWPIAKPAPIVTQSSLFGDSDQPGVMLEKQVQINKR